MVMRLLDKLNNPLAFAVAVILFLIVDGLIIYRHNALYSGSSETGSSPTITQPESNETALLSTPSTEPPQVVTTESTAKEAPLTTVPETTTNSPVENPKGHSVTVSV